jgi:two-component system sensor histidine kinase TctE
MASLRSRLTAAVMVPLLALAVTFGGITCWMIERSEALTSDRILVGSVRVLSRAVDAGEGVRADLLPLAVHLLQRRSAPVTLYSIWDGERLVAGTRGLVPPSHYEARTGRWTTRVPAASFPRTFRNTHLTAGYVDTRDAQGWSSPPICATPCWATNPCAWPPKCAAFIAMAMPWSCRWPISPMIAPPICKPISCAWWGQGC